MTTTEAEAMSAPLSAVDSMLAALRQVQEADEPLSGFEAGEILVAAGWACFPVPAGRKFDQGYSYIDATTSPAEWRELVTRLQARNRYITDVNVAVCPFKCAVPMTVVDHDSAVGLFDFTNEWHDKTGGAPDTLRIASPSGNEHYWFENEEPLANGYHPWGGETRSANGHVLLPPSWADEGSYQAINFNRPVRIDDVPWVLRGGRRRADDRERSRLTHSDVDIEIAKLSVREWAPGGHDMLNAIISKMTSVGHPGRNPAMAAAVNDMLDASLTGLIPAREGLALLGAAYAKHVSDTRDEEQALGEVARMSKVWVERHPHLDDEIGAVAWAQKEGQNLGSAAGAAAEPETATEASAEGDLNPYGWVDFDSEAFWHQPPPRYYIPRMLVETQVCTIYSAGGLGKSLLAQDIVAGLVWRGRVFGEEIEKAPVVYIDRENSARGLLKRLRAMGVTEKDAPILRERLHYSLLGAWPALDSREGSIALYKEMRRTGAKLLVLDTLSKVVDGEENSNDTWKGLHQHTMIGLKRMGVTVLQLDHTGKDADRGQRGGSSKHDNADAVWHLTATPDGSYVQLHRKKDRDGDYEEILFLERSSFPNLEHRFVEALPAAAAYQITREAKIDELVQAIEILKLDKKMGRGKVSEALTDAGMKFNNNDLADALKKWKTPVV
jgi:hypothetical protein